MCEYKNAVIKVLKKCGINYGNVVVAFNISTSELRIDEYKLINASIDKIEGVLKNTEDVQAVLINDQVIENKENILNLSQYLKNTKICLIFCAKNPISREEVFELLSGHRESFMKLSGYSFSAAKEYFNQNGFELIAEEKIEAADNGRKVKTDNVFLQKGSAVYQYLVWLEEFVHADLNTDYYVQAYRKVNRLLQKKKIEKELPFLSIITRTQGRRIEALREVFLCLAGQDCMDFEVLVMGHNISREAEEKVLNVIEDTPDYLREKIRFVPVKGGNRSTPINEGFKEASGKYAVILDDDDIVFDNWVSSFKLKEKEYPGSVLHAYVIAQDWTVVPRRDGESILRASGAPQSQFCQEFHIVKELNSNFCPILGLAFPLYPFRKMDMKFDETLDTTEDWDYLMRISSVCGVVDIDEPTSMYRLWKNMENSHSLHNNDEWNQNRKKIQKKICEKPLIIPQKYINEIINVNEKNPGLFGKEISQTVTPLYYDNGNGFSENYVKRVGNREKVPNVFYEFTGFEDTGNISSIRWDPSESGNICVNNLRIQIILANGKVIEKNINHVVSNGFKMKNQIVFFHPDPQIILHFKNSNNISRVIITGTIINDISEEMHNYLSIHYNSGIIQNSCRIIKKIGKKILKKQ